MGIFSGIFSKKKRDADSVSELKARIAELEEIIAEEPLRRQRAEALAIRRFREEIFTRQQEAMETKAYEKVLNKNWDEHTEVLKSGGRAAEALRQEITGLKRVIDEAYKQNALLREERARLFKNWDEE